MEGRDAGEISRSFQAGESRVIPVIREELVITKERVETGKVLVSKLVSEEEMVVDASIFHDEVVVERKAINQYVDSAPPAVRHDGDVTIVSVMKEVLVVEKRLMLVEELHITRRHRTEPQTVTQTLRKEEIIINREGGSTSGTDI